MDNYIQVQFAALVARGRARVIEWDVVNGREVGYDHDLMVWCYAPGRFPGS